MSNIVFDEQGVRHVFPDEATPMQMMQAMRASQPPPQTAFGSMGPAIQHSPLFQAINTQRHMLPGYGAAIGGAADLPGGVVPGAAVGAGIGRAIQQATNPMFGEAAPSGPLQANAQQAMSAAGGAFNAGGPQQLAQEGAPVLKGLASKLEGTALGTYTKKMQQAVQTAIEEHIGPGFRNQAVQQIKDRVAAIGSSVNGMLQRAKDAGLYHDVGQIADGGKQLMNDPALEADERSTIASWNDKLTKKFDTVGQDKVDPVTLNKMRQKYDDEAKPIYDALANPKKYPIPNADQTLRARWAKATADNMRSMLQDPGTSPAAVPGLADAQQQISKLYNLGNTIAPKEWQSAQRLLPFAPMAGGALAGGLLPAHSWHQRLMNIAALGAVTSPQGLSNAAMLLTNPDASSIVSQLLRAGTPVAEATQTPKPQ